MSIFDELGKKISQAGQSAMQKTREMSETAKYNSIISEEERKLDNNYYQIGKLYVATHQNDYEPDFANLINSIKESQRIIAENRQKIHDIKGILRCEKCGQDNPRGNAFCSGCGAPIQESVGSGTNKVKCPSCGSMVDKDMRFCTSCGTPMISGEESKKCSKCGNTIDSDSSFCTHCGNPV